MDLSSKALVQLQRLARLVKKQTGFSVLLSNKSGIFKLLSYVEKQPQTVEVYQAYSALLAEMNEQEKQYLRDSSDSLQPNIINDDSHLVALNSEQQIYHERRQVNLPLNKDRRAGEERRVNHLSFDGEERRTKVTLNTSNGDESKASASSANTHTKMGVYQGKLIELND